MMTQRENLLALLRRQGYEWMPPEFILCPSLEMEFKKKVGEEDYRRYFQMPWRDIPALKPDQKNRERFYKYYNELNERTEIDDWGVGHESSPNAMHMTRMLHPLDRAERVEEIMDYPMPSFSGEGNGQLEEDIRRIQQEGLVAVGNMQCTIWETAWYIRGMENLMMDMLSEEEMAEAMLDKALEMSMQRALLYAQAGADILFVGDDIGMQQSILMSEELYRKWIWPRLKRLIEKVKARKPDILIFYHSCGYIEPFIPSLIQAGIDVLNPIQPECMDFEKIYQNYGNQISFHGTIGTQSTMPFGTPKEIKSLVKRNLDIAGSQGGLWAAPTHLLEPEVPWENILAYVEACRAYK